MSDWYRIAAAAIVLGFLIFAVLFIVMNLVTPDG